MDTEILNNSTLRSEASHVDQAVNEQMQKRPFVRPVLTRCAKLPDVTAALIGTFLVPTSRR